MMRVAVNTHELIVKKQGFSSNFRLIPLQLIIVFLMHIIHILRTIYLF
jgi:hypothetical protein